MTDNKGAGRERCQDSRVPVSHAKRQFKLEI